MWTSAGIPSPPGPVVRICTRAWPMSSGTAMSIQFLLVRCSVGDGCKSFWYSICMGRRLAKVAFTYPAHSLFPSSQCWSSPFLSPVGQDQALEQAPHWWEESLQTAEPSLQTPSAGRTLILPLVHRRPLEPSLPEVLPSAPFLLSLLQATCVLWPRQSRTLLMSDSEPSRSTLQLAVSPGNVEELCLTTQCLVKPFLTL